MYYQWLVFWGSLGTLLCSLSCEGQRHRASGVGDQRTEFDDAAGGAGGEGPFAVDSEANDAAGTGNLERGDASRFCIISADCASGRFCDLGECVATCSKNSDCEGGLTCSKRGRCIEPGTADRDTTPPHNNDGTVKITHTRLPPNQ